MEWLTWKIEIYVYVMTHLNDRDTCICMIYTNDRDIQICNDLHEWQRYMYMLWFTLMIKICECMMTCIADGDI